MAHQIEKDNSFVVNPPSVARILYNLSKIDYKSNIVERIILNDIENWKNKFNMKFAFGFYYGALRLNMDKNLIYFARAEYENHFKKKETHDEEMSAFPFYFGTLQTF